MKRIKIVAIIMIITVLIVGCGEKTDDNKISKREFLMGTVVDIDVYDKLDEEILEKVYDRLFEIESKMSKTIKTSDINKVNKKSGINSVQVDEETWKTIKKTKNLSNLTGGEFDPTIGPLSNLWEINSSDPDRKNIPKDKDIKRLLNKINYENIILENNNKVYLKESGMELDLGGSAKGFAADEAKKILMENGSNSAMIDLGGDLYALGEKPNGEAWRIGVRDPRSENKDYLGVLEIRDKSMVTSGDYERYFEVEGKRYHHIIDPKTGYPVDNDLMSVTIISNSSLEGDVFSTASFIMGLDNGKNFIENQKEIEGIFITKDKNIYLTSGVEDKFTLRDIDGEYKLIKE